MSDAASLLGGLVDKAADKVGTDAGKWVDAGLARRADVIAALPGDIRPLGAAVADVLVAKRDVLVATSREGFTAITVRLALGQEDEARLIFIRDSATFDERMDARDAASAATRQERIDRDVAWAAVKDAALEILKVAGKTALPLLLAMI